MISYRKALLAPFLFAGAVAAGIRTAENFDMAYMNRTHEYRPAVSNYTGDPGRDFVANALTCGFLLTVGLRQLQDKD